MYRVKFTGILKSNPFPNTLSVADRFPIHLIGENEFSLIDRFVIDEDLPVFINSALHVLLLELLVEKCQILFPDVEKILLKYISNNIRLSPIFLVDKILLLHDPFEESTRLAENDISNVCIYDTLLKRRTETGTNSLVIEYCSKKLENLNSFKHLIKYVTQIGVQKCRN